MESGKVNHAYLTAEVVQLEKFSHGVRRQQLKIQMETDGDEQNKDAPTDLLTGSPGAVATSQKDVASLSLKSLNKAQDEDVEMDDVVEKLKGEIGYGSVTSLLPEVIEASLRDVVEQQSVVKGKTTENKSLQQAEKAVVVAATSKSKEKTTTKPSSRSQSDDEVEIIDNPFGQFICQNS